MRCWVRGRDFWLEIPSGPVGINQRVKKYVYIYFFNRYLPKLKIASSGVQCPIYDLGHDTELIFPQKNFFKLKFVYSRLQFGMSLQVALGFRTRSIWIGISRSCDVTSHSYCVHMAIVLIGLWISVLECWWTKHWLDIYFWQLICRTQFMSIIY